MMKITATTAIPYKAVELTPLVTVDVAVAPETVAVTVEPLDATVVVTVAAPVVTVLTDVAVVVAAAPETVTVVVPVAVAALEEGAVVRDRAMRSPGEELAAKS